MKWHAFSIRKLALPYIVLSLIVSLAPSHIALAEANQLIVTPSSSQMKKGTTFCVDIKSYGATDETSGTAVGTLNYTASKLQYVSGSVKTSGKTCNGSTSSNHYGSHTVSHSSGKLKFNADRDPADGGIAQIFMVKFKAIAGGSATLKFSSNSYVNDASTSYKHGAYNITDPSPPKSTPKPAPTISTTPAPSVSEPTDTEPDPDPTGIVTDVTIEAGYDTATIKWKVDGSKPKATIGYGLDATNPSGNVEPTKKGNEFTAKITDLTPGARYYFTISGTGSGKTGEYSSVIYPRGLPVVLTVTENGVPAANATVQIGNINNSTDATGKLALGLSPGDYSGTITTQTATLDINLSVAAKEIPTDGSAPAQQSFPFELESSVLDGGAGSGTSILIFVGVLVFGLVLLGVGLLIFVNWRKRRFDMDEAGSTMRQSVVVQDSFDWEKYSGSTSTAGPPPAPPKPQPPQQYTGPARGNSVYVDDDEPIDMFDFSKKPAAPEPPASTPPTDNQPLADEPLREKEEENEGSGINIRH